MKDDSFLDSLIQSYAIDIPGVIVFDVDQQLNTVNIWQHIEISGFRVLGW